MENRPTTTPKHLLQQYNGAMVILDNGEAYIYYLGNLMDGSKTIPLDDYDDLLRNYNGDGNVECFYSPLPHGEAKMSTEGRFKVWVRSNGEDKTRKFLEKVIYKYGKIMQQDIAIEEMSELTKALLKLRRAEYENINGRDLHQEKNAVYEEIADVEIMVEQLKIMFDCYSDVESWKEAKLQRLSERLGQEK